MSEKVVSLLDYGAGNVRSLRYEVTAILLTHKKVLEMQLKHLDLKFTIFRLPMILKMQIQSYFLVLEASDKPSLYAILEVLA
jgi:hypothetical protein